MKGLFKMLVGMIIVFVVLVGALFSYLSPAERDQLNPFVKEELRYFQVTKDGIPDGPKGRQRFGYEIIAYNAEGEPLGLYLTAASNLRHGAYIEVLTKGQHVEAWQEVQIEDFPEMAREVIAE